MMKTPEDNKEQGLSRREFLLKLGAGALGLAAIIGNITSNTKKDISKTVKEGRGGEDDKEKTGHSIEVPEIQKFQTSGHVKFKHGTKLKKIAPAQLPKLIGHDSLVENMNPREPQELDRIRSEYEFYDPRHTQPLLFIDPEDLEKTISKYFKVKDFVLIDTKDLKYVKPGFYQEHEGKFYRTVARINPELIEVLDLLNEKAKADAAEMKTGETEALISINEGFRPYGENLATAVGNGDAIHPRSQHVSGSAVDIDKLSSQPDVQTWGFEILKKWGKGGGIGLHGPTTLHVDVRHGEKIATWSYL